jgi:hypothetical protein
MILLRFQKCSQLILDMLIINDLSHWTDIFTTIIQTGPEFPLISGITVHWVLHLPA